MSGAPAPKSLSALSPEVIAYSNGPALLAQTGSMFALAALVVLGRCYTRVLVVKSFGKDDWAMLGAMVSNTQSSSLANCLLTGSADIRNSDIHSLRHPNLPRSRKARRRNPSRRRRFPQSPQSPANTHDICSRRSFTRQNFYLFLLAAARDTESVFLVSVGPCCFHDGFYPRLHGHARTFVI